MIRYEKPIIKTAAEMMPGDIFRTEYGDYGNWCELVFVCCGMSVPGCTMTVFHHIGRKNIKRCYEYTDINRVTYTVIGRESA